MAHVASNVEEFGAGSHTGEDNGVRWVAGDTGPEERPNAGTGVGANEPCFLALWGRRVVVVLAKDSVDSLSRRCVSKHHLGVNHRRSRAHNEPTKESINTYFPSFWMKVHFWRDLVVDCREKPWVVFVWYFRCDGVRDGLGS